MALEKLFYEKKKIDRNELAAGNSDGGHPTISAVLT